MALVSSPRRSWLASKILANLSSKFCRSEFVILRHGESRANALFAALTASSTSSSPATGILLLTSSPFAGLKTETLQTAQPLLLKKSLRRSYVFLLRQSTYCNGKQMKRVRQVKR